MDESKGRLRKGKRKMRWWENLLDNGVGGAIADASKMLINMGIDFYNSVIDKASELLMMSPVSFGVEDGEKVGQAWKALNAVNASFVAVGSSMVGFFFLWGMYNQLRDSKFEVRFEGILFDFIRLLIAEYFVSNNLYIIKGFLKIFADLMDAVVGKNGNAFISLSLSNKVSEYLKEIDTLSKAIPVLIPSLIFMIVIIIIALGILFQSFKRILKVMIIIPWGAIASATLAGDNMVRQTAMGFWKYCLSAMGEAVTMLVILKIYGAYFSGGMTLFVGEQMQGAVYICAWLFEKAFISFTALGLISSAGTITQRALGL